MKRLYKKVYMPSLPQIFVKRAELNRKLNEAARNESLYVYAPTGYGKTVSVSWWISKNKRKAAWLSLDRYDNDPTAFLRGCILAIKRQNAETDPKSFNWLYSKNFESSPLKSALEFIEAQDHTIDTLVLDDFQFINNSFIIESLYLLKKRLPSHTICIIISRSQAPEYFAKWQLEQKVSLITEQDLCFSIAETEDLLYKHGIILDNTAAAHLQKSSNGWAAALTTVGMSYTNDDFIHFSNVFSNRLFHNYLYSEISNILDEEKISFLVKTSIADVLPVKFCEFITSRKDSEDILTHLMIHTGFVTKTDVSEFRCHPLLRSFLMSLFKLFDTEKKTIFISASKWFLGNNRPITALALAVESGEIGFVEEVRRKMLNADICRIGMRKCYHYVNKLVLKKLPQPLIENSTKLSLDAVWVSFAKGEIDDAKRGMNVLKLILQDKFNIVDEDLIIYIALCILIPFDSLSNEAMPEKTAELLKDLPTTYLAFNMPFFHRVQQDYSVIITAWDDSLTEKRRPLSNVWEFLPLALKLCFKGGLLYEQNLLSEAYDTALEAEKKMVHGDADLFFCIKMLLCEILFAQKRNKKADELLKQTAADIENMGASYLYPNFNAYTARRAFYQGDKKAAQLWLNRQAYDIIDTPCFYQNYQNLTTARALMATGSTTKATEFLKKLEHFFISTNRRIDYIETKTLLALICWKQKQWDEAAAEMEQAAITAQNGAFYRTIASEGRDIAPILGKILKKKE